jgi:cyclopropane fatty-acyl-phospholipid synthase-like methyltransferase
VSPGSKIDELYSSIPPQVWKDILGDELHYHFGCYETDETTFEEALRQTVRNFYDHIEPGSKVLDAGCGWGGAALMLESELDCRVTGVTLSRSQFDYCRKGGLDIVLADLEVMDFRGMEFDMVLAIESMEHIRSRQNLFGEMRMLASKFLLRVNCVADLRTAADGYIDSWAMWMETPETICRRLERAGWKIESMTNRRDIHARTQAHWKERLGAIYKDSPPPGQLGILNNMCDVSLSNKEAWAKAYPLIDIVAV